MAKRIRTRRQAMTLRAGIERGRETGLNFEKVGGGLTAFGYLNLGSQTATVTIDGKSRLVNFDLFSSGWDKGFSDSYNSRFTGLSAEETEILQKSIRREYDIRIGFIKKVDLTFEDGSKATAYMDA